MPILMLGLAAGDAFLTSIVSLGTVADISNVVRWEQLDRQHSTSLDLTALGLRREERSAYPPPYERFLNNDQLITKIPVLDAYSPAQNNYHHIIARDPHLKDMALGSERIWFAREIAQGAPNEENLTTYRSRSATLNGFPIIVHSPAQMLWPKQIDNAALDEAGRIASLPAAEKVTVKLLKYSPEEFTFDAQSPADGWLLITDRWARSWKGEVNDRQVPVYGGNFIFRAVPVSAGQNRIRFSYHQFAFPWLIVLSWGILAVVLARTINRYWR